MTEDKVSIVILNYNTRDLLERFIPSVLATEYDNFEVVVADNASSDGSLDLVRKLFPEVKCIALEENYGFAGGYNRALKELDTPYWVLLNSDVEVDKGWLSPLMELITSNPKIGAVQPKILDLNNRGRFEYAGASGGFIDKFAYPFCRGRLSDVLEQDEGQYDDNIPVFWATGAALLVRASEYQKLGGLDADFFAHMEEIDLCWRMKNAGLEVWVCPEGKVYHMGGGTLSAQSSHKTFLNFRNNLALITKNLPFSEWVKVFCARLILDGIAGVVMLYNGKGKHTWAIVKAHWAFFWRFRFWWSKRKTSPTPLPFLQHQGMLNISLVRRHFIKGIKHFSDLL